MSRPARSPSSSDLVELQRTLYESKNPTRRWLHRERMGRIEAELAAAAARSGSVRALEVGPGAGPYVPILCDAFGEVVATDVESEYLEHVEAVHGARPNLTLMADDIADSALEAASFDVVLCSEVIEHTKEPALVLAGIFDLLRPRGTLVLSTPQAGSTVELLGRVAFLPGIIRIVRAIYREPVLPTGHISLLTRRSLGRLIDETGFEVVASSLSGLYLPGLAEVGGEAAVRLERGLEARLAGGPLSWLLWTQYWTCERPR